MRFPNWTAMVMAAVLAGAGVARADNGKVVIGQINISFYAVTAGVVQEVLERLGHQVETKSGSHGQMFPLLDRGEVDLLVAAWLPSAHAEYWEKYGGKATQLATLYTNAQLYWSVPSYVPATEVASVADLRKPAVAQRMVRTIRATAPDSGLTIGSRKIMDSYHLDEAGYELLPGKRDEWVAHLQDNIAAQRWFVMPFFRPNYLNLSADMRVLEEPQKLLGEPSDGKLVARKDFVARAPERTLKALSRISVGLDGVAEMDRMVNLEKMSARDAARVWMERNRDVVDTWFEG